MDLKTALDELRKEKKRKFSQSIDAIINLKGLDLRKDNITVILAIPHKLKDKKVCGFLNAKSSLVSTITKPEFPKYKEKNALKKLVKEYDFFIASAPLMPSVATTFGKVLGPAGKMPSPQLGVLLNENDSAIQQVLDKIAQSVKIRVKEASVKLSIGTELMTNEQIMENFKVLYDGIVNALPNKKENVKNVMLKLTMSKPIKLGVI